ncbi:MAG: hypothetical protein HUJ26_20610 [Planctomycetaceae bacterium]|nr:hypothetical protein [Planctomycetaceae bacterium]
MNNSFTTFRSVIEALRRQDAGDDSKPETTDFNIYWEDRARGPNLDDEVFVGSPVPVDDGVPDDEYDHALLPQVVKDRGWWLAYSGELLENVVTNALMQKPDVTTEELLAALRHYAEYDNFLELP